MPRKASAKGPKPAVPALLHELGRGGVRRAGGYVQSDFLPILAGSRGALLYREMSRNEPILFAIMQAVKMLTRRIKWRVEPFKEDGKTKATPEAEKWASWLRTEVFIRMRTPMPQVLADMATKFEFGYAPLEVVWAKRDDGRIGIDKMALRAQATIESWIFDENGEVTGLWQQDSTQPTRVRIDAEKLLMTQTTFEEGNPEGLSLLRGCVIPYHRKKAIEEAEGRAAIRSAGIVKIKVPGRLLQADASSEDAAARAAFEAMGAALAEDRQGYILISSDVDPDSRTPLYDVSFEIGDGQRSGNMSPVIERYEKRMAGSALADFLLLGQQAVGSFSMHEDKTNLFAQSLEGFADIDEAALNRQVISRLWSFNGLPEETQPKLVHGSLGKADLAALSAFVEAMTRAGYFSPEPEMAEHLADLAELPKPVVRPPEQLGPGGAPLPGQQGTRVAAKPNGATPVRRKSNAPSGARHRVTTAEEKPGE